MELSVLQEDLLQGLTIVSRFVSPRSQLPVLANILFSARAGKLRLAATNLEMGVSFRVGARLSQDGETTVPARLVLDLVSSLPPGKITLKEGGGQLAFSSGGFSATLVTLPANEFPPLTHEAAEKGIQLKTAALGTLARQVAFAAALDESRPALSGILLLFGKTLRAVATDGFRLSYKELTGEGRAEEEKLLVPARAITEMAKAETSEEVEISRLTRESQILFSGGDMVLTSRLLEGEFPDFEKIMPHSAAYQFTAQKEELTRAVKAAAVFAREGANILHVKILAGKVKITAESQQFGHEEAEVEAQTKGGEIEVAFNHHYLLEFLGSVDGEEIFFATEGPTAPGLFQEAGDSSYKHLIMPVRIQL